MRWGWWGARTFKCFSCNSHSTMLGSFSFFNLMPMINVHRPDERNSTYRRPFSFFTNFWVSKVFAFFAAFLTSFRSWCYCERQWLCVYGTTTRAAHQFSSDFQPCVSLSKKMRIRIYTKESLLPTSLEGSKRFRFMPPFWELSFIVYSPWSVTEAELIVTKGRS